MDTLGNCSFLSGWLPAGSPLSPPPAERHRWTSSQLSSSFLALSSPTENTHEVVLKKNLSGLGFSFLISELNSGPDRGSMVQVKWLFEGQPAKESGQIQQGDIILAVNGEPVKDVSYQDRKSVV